MVTFLDLKAVNAQYQRELKEACARVIDSGWFIMGNEANALAVQEQKEWAGNVDKALGDWRIKRDAQDKKTADLRKQLEAARHDDKTFSAWADSPLPDAAVRLLQSGAAR